MGTAKPVRVGLFVFDGAEELDVVGPYDVLSHWAGISALRPQVTTFSTDGLGVRLAKGLNLVPDTSAAEVGPLTVLIHPGGQGTRPLAADPAHLAWVRQMRATTPILASVRGGLNLTSDVLIFLVTVVVSALFGGIVTALVAAVIASMLLNYYFILPLYSITIAKPNNILALAVFVVVALTVATVVDKATRQTRRAANATAEAASATLAMSARRRVHDKEFRCMTSSPGVMPSRIGHGFEGASKSSKHCSASANCRRASGRSGVYARISHCGVLH